MELIKRSEAFNLKDTTDKFVTKGTVNCETSGTLNIHFNVNSVSGLFFGDCNYSTYGERNDMNFSLNCAEENRADFTVYANELISQIRENFK